ncbi:MAG: hypothetical protein ACYCSN_12370 [Acidobacteriaceae bacterium]
MNMVTRREAAEIEQKNVAHRAVVAQRQAARLEEIESSHQALRRAVDLLGLDPDKVIAAMRAEQNSECWLQTMFAANISIDPSHTTPGLSPRGIEAHSHALDSLRSGKPQR